MVCAKTEKNPSRLQLAWRHKKAYPKDTVMIQGTGEYDLQFSVNLIKDTHVAYVVSQRD